MRFPCVAFPVAVLLIDYDSTPSREPPRNVSCSLVKTKTVLHIALRNIFLGNRDTVVGTALENSHRRLFGQRRPA